MEEKTIPDYETNKKGTSSELTEKRSDGRNKDPSGRNPDASRRIETTDWIWARNRIDRKRIGQEPESNSDEESTEGEVEPVVKTKAKDIL